MSSALVRIGITTYREPARWGAWDQPADLLPAAYATAVQDAGGVAVLLPPAPATHAATALDAVAGLIVAGGADVDPARYAAAPQPTTDAARRDRDSWEFALVGAALERDLPLLGICRGLQVLNVHLGGTLVQHLPDLVGGEVHRPVLGGFGTHPVAIAEGGRLARAYGPRAHVATHHHQAIERLGDGLVRCAWADDGVIEAVELPGRRYVVGVQWHPEVHGHDALVDDFVAACRERPAA